MGRPYRSKVVEEIGRHLLERSSIMGRWILWQSALMELYDSPRLPQDCREYEIPIEYRIPRGCGQNKA